LVKAVRENGTIKVKAQTANGLVSSNEVTITISNQVVTTAEISFIKMVISLKVQMVNKIGVDQVL
jgi:hypothetical protein